MSGVWSKSRRRPKACTSSRRSITIPSPSCLAVCHTWLSASAEVAAPTGAVGGTAQSGQSPQAGTSRALRCCDVMRPKSIEPSQWFLLTWDGMLLTFSVLMRYAQGAQMAVEPTTPDVARLYEVIGQRVRQVRERQQLKQ